MDGPQERIRYSIGSSVARRQTVFEYTHYLVKFSSRCPQQLILCVMLVILEPDYQSIISDNRRDSVRRVKYLGISADTVEKKPRPNPQC